MKVSRFAKITVMLNCAVPAILLAWDALRGQLGANPVNFAIRTTGILSLIFLCLTLLVTPLGRISRQSWLGQFRRMLGLCAFYYAAAHFLIFFGFDRGARVGDTFSEIFKRKYLMVGTLGLGLMVPLAVTSTDRMIRRIGGARWKQLHRLTYVVAIAAILHFYMLVKADISRPVAFGIVVGLLLGYRFAVHYWQLRSASRQLRLGESAVVPARASASSPKLWSGQLRVARIFQETPDVRTFRLVAVDSPRLPFDYLPGQYLNLSIQVDGKRVNRSYTIASSPTRLAYCEITVKREPMGVSSRHLHDTLAEGSLIDVKAPAGRFTFTGSETDAIVLIAGGVGITPLMSKIRHLTDIGWPGKIDMIIGVKDQRNIIFCDELEYLQRRFPNLRVTVTLSRAEGSEWRGERGRISAELLSRVVDRISERRVHVCGPVEMMDSTVVILQGLGVPENQIHSNPLFGQLGLERMVPRVLTVRSPSFRNRTKLTASPRSRLPGLANRSQWITARRFSKPRKSYESTSPTTAERGSAASVRSSDFPAALSWTSRTRWISPIGEARSSSVARLDASGLLLLTHEQYRIPFSMRRSNVMRRSIHVLSLALVALLGIGASAGDDNRPLRIQNAPEFEGVTRWINSKPLTMKELRGKVVVVHFWTNGCYNCVNNYEHYRAWQERYAGKDVVIIGVHSPETASEHDIARIEKQAKKHNLKFPIAVDNETRNWEAWKNKVWPTVYVVDRRGVVRYGWEGELNYKGQKGEETVRKLIDSLLAETTAKETR